MRVKVVRTPGEIRDSIGHKVIVRKDWIGTVDRELGDDEISAAGFYPGRHEKFYAIKFDDWAQEVVLPATHVVVVHDAEAEPQD